MFRILFSEYSERGVKTIYVHPFRFKQPDITDQQSTDRKDDGQRIYDGVQIRTDDPGQHVHAGMDLFRQAWSD